MEFYRTMEDDLGFRIKASYFEPGMAIVGEWSEGDSYDFSIDTENLDSIPQHLQDEWDIASWYEGEEGEEE